MKKNYTGFPSIFHVYKLVFRLKLLKIHPKYKPLIYKKYISGVIKHSISSNF